MSEFHFLPVLLKSIQKYSNSANFREIFIKPDMHIPMYIVYNLWRYHENTFVRSWLNHQIIYSVCQEFCQLGVFNEFVHKPAHRNSEYFSEFTTQKTHISGKKLNTGNEPKIWSKTTGHVCCTQEISRRITEEFWRKLNLKLGLFFFVLPVSFDLDLERSTHETHDLRITWGTFF